MLGPVTALEEQEQDPQPAVQLEAGHGLGDVHAGGEAGLTGQPPLPQRGLTRSPDQDTAALGDGHSYEEGPGARRLGGRADVGTSRPAAGRPSPEDDVLLVDDYHLAGPA